ncbi:MAG TPA: type I restriction endonuclease subunit R [Oligoflexia bacterium]|nr:type I restriction endonuclease subunit R [Oligoflexia bacterium]HMP47305.1 type I restriction endonuclease subunit R [Oligoflexia bacterium]
MSESEIENKLLEKLKDLKYTYNKNIKDRAALERNFRHHFEALNKVALTDSEFARLMDQVITPDVYAASKMLREYNSFERDDGTPLNYSLVNIKDWCKNNFEVVNQLRINTDNSHHRYDVFLLINGLPLVQVELKTLSISPRKAIQQIVDYKNEPGNGYGKTLLCFVQLFIVSNEHATWYFSNNNNSHFAFDADERFLPVYQFAAKDNKKINHLHDFSESFLSKCTLGNMISKYMVLVATEQKMLIMRPYQIYAVKAIVDCIKDNCGNGYIWHTTGSGKTLTSFKASTLLKDNPDIEKCIFVVDRKDLDRQTREEFNRFQEKCVEENTDTRKLVNRLLSNDYADKVIVTTIQKLGIALKGTNNSSLETNKGRSSNGFSKKRNYVEELAPLKNKRIVFIFDECHRSQFGEYHKTIKEFFPNSQLFGFTGTPIFEDNATYIKVDGEEASFKTTKDIFERELHAYTITNAIEDKNVLKFHVDYYKAEEGLKVKKGEEITKKAILKSILKKHESATAGRKFNALFATSSINDAIEYYKLFSEIQLSKLTENPEYKSLNIACVFSPPSDVSPEVAQIQEDLEQEKEDNKVNPDEKKAALTEIINEYNLKFSTNFSISDFDSYYKDVQQRIKDQKFPNQDFPHEQKIDILIVVDMLLTGFDSVYLNTLYIDKNLKYHGLIQAFSRTNRVLNDTKPNGIIIDFRNQQDKVDEAIKLFSGEDGESAKEIWLVDSAPVLIQHYEESVRQLEEFMGNQGLILSPDQIPNIKGDEARIQFIRLFQEVQRDKTKLDQFTDLTPEQIQEIHNILPPDVLTGFKGEYMETARGFRDRPRKNDDTGKAIEQLDFEFVLFSSAVIDYDYIMKLASDYTKGGTKSEQMTKEQLLELIRSDAKFINDREYLEEYIQTLKVGASLNEREIREGLNRFIAEKNNKRIYEIADKHSISQKELKNLIDITIRRTIFDGEALSELFLRLDLGWKERSQRELSLMDDLIPLLNKLSQGRNISGLQAYERR